MSCHPRQLKSLLFETACCVELHAVPAYCLSFDTRLISLDRHQVSTLQTKVRSPAAWFPSNGHHAVTLKITARQLETAARRFFVTCAAAQLRGNIGRVAAAKFADRRTDGRTDAVSFHRPCYAYYTVCGSISEKSRAACRTALTVMTFSNFEGHFSFLEPLELLYAEKYNTQ